MDARVTGLFIAGRRKEPRRSTSEIELVVDHGVEGDAYAGPGDRQVVFFEDDARRALDAAENRGLCYARFHENIRVEGLELRTLSAGARLSIGETEVEITSARKRCYPECELPRGTCHILGHVAFARVLRGGSIAVGAPVWRE
jgi:cyclic pyranopterin phosphate synthase